SPPSAASRAPVREAGAAATTRVSPPPIASARSSEMPTYVLGISALYHDAAACLLRDGEIVLAVEEERLSRIKHDRAYPARAIAACLDAAGIAPADVDAVVFYEKTLPKLERQLESW